jgi:uncharacterized protein (TIGR02301 family)
MAFGIQGDLRTLSRVLPTERRALIALALSGALVLGTHQPTAAQSAQVPSDARPYDEKLLRLSDILGSIHFLRELCGHSDGQLWRDKMRELTDAEGSSALRRAKLARGFNNGYRSYSRSYTTCTPSAETATARLINEAAEIAETLVRNIP